MRLQRFRRRLRGEHGATMIVALGVLLVTSLLTAAVLLSVQSGAHDVGANLDGNRAYAAAESGVQAYLHALNANSSESSWWETCANDTTADYPDPVPVAGSTTGAGYAYQPVPANGATACSDSDPVSTLIDSTTGVLRIEVTGFSGSEQRTIIASFRPLTPLSFLWYTVHETLDPAAGPETSTRTQECANVPFYWQEGTTDPETKEPYPSIPTGCQVEWASGDQVNGPMYTQDQLLIGPKADPSFGRKGSDDEIVSEAPSTNPDAVCVDDDCQNATFSDKQTLEMGNVQKITLPADNSNMETDAEDYGKVFTGTINITLDDSTMEVVNCESESSCTSYSYPIGTATGSVPIIYTTNASACNTSYDPTNVTYPTTSSGYAYGPCGDIYVTGTYSEPLTLAAANDIVVERGTVGGVLNSTDTDPTGNYQSEQLTGTATLGLVADEYVRVQHTCSGNPDVTIDAAILTVQHSFFVDNYSCGSGSQGILTVHGAIAQYYRGAVGTVGATGYVKNYNYDDRLAHILPPYLFDLQSTDWTILSETLCSTSLASGTSGACDLP